MVQDVYFMKLLRYVQRSRRRSTTGRKRQKRQSLREVVVIGLEIVEPSAVLQHLSVLLGWQLVLAVEDEVLELRGGQRGGG